MSEGSARGFASDSSAGIHPAVLEALSAANRGHAFGYGHDDRTRAAEKLFADHFGDDARVFFVFNGIVLARALSQTASERPPTQACKQWPGCAERAHREAEA